MTEQQQSVYLTVPTDEGRMRDAPDVWIVSDSQGVYGLHETEDSARAWCDRYNARNEGDPLRPYTYRRYVAADVAVHPAEPLAPTGWISVDERMPEDGTECLIYIPDGSGDGCIQTDMWREQHECPVDFSTVSVPIGLAWDCHDYTEVSHWMPLPAPPAGNGASEAPQSNGRAVPEAVALDWMTENNGAWCGMYDTPGLFYGPFEARKLIVAPTLREAIRIAMAGNQETGNHD